MEKTIRTTNEYRETFHNSKKNEQALEYSLDIRKFEIDLYWKRTTYFWALIAISFTGYFALADDVEKNAALMTVVGSIGLVLSTGWYLVNRGSKYWQTNWERHVDSLEDEIIGPLYKTTISKSEFRFFRFWDGYPFSVSKINQLISLYISFIWCGLFIFAISRDSSFSNFGKIGTWAFGMFTIVFLGLLFGVARGGSQTKARRVSFHSSGLTSSDGAKSD